ncbi:MAG TPA: cyanophycin synthetase [Longimicrobium sp.]|jgi:cyanophycin synthetase
MKGDGRLADGLRLRAVGALRGRSLWAPVAAVVAEVEEGALAGTTCGEVDGFAERLTALFPGLADEAGGLAWPEAVARVAAELQARAGAPPPLVRVKPAAGDDPAVVAVGYDEEPLGVEALHEAAVLVRECIRGEEVRLEEVLAELRAAYARSHPGPTASVLAEAARGRGIPVRRSEDRVIQLGLGRNLRRIDAAMTDFTSVIAADITSDKHRTKQVLERIGLAVPEGEVVTTLEDALELVADLGVPVLLKPLDANDGRGISGRLDTPDAVRAAWVLAVAEHPRVIVERFVTGRDHRIVVVDGRVVAVAERVPAHVVGDGRRSIRELAEEENLNPKRNPRDPASPLVPLPLDDLTERFLARTGRTLDSIPHVGEEVQLRGTANISTGGTSIDRTDELHPRNATLCEFAAAAVGLDIAGIDVLTDDVGVPFDENCAAIVEINASPGIRMHTDPDVGTPRDVPAAILDMLYPPGSESRIPVIALTGTNGKTTTTRLVSHIIRGTGRKVGFTTTDGVYFEDTLLMHGDLTGPFAANVVLSDPRVDVAVLETARGGILKSGLGFDVCDVGVVLNVSADHMGQRGIHTLEQLAEVKAVIPAAVCAGGHAVLNADDPLVFEMKSRTQGDVVLISAKGDANPHVVAHLAGGGAAVVAETHEGRESFVLRLGSERLPVVPVDEVPLTMGGAARFQFENIMAAVAVAHALAVPPVKIAEGLRTFVPSRKATPGRLNVLPAGRGRVVVDYAHNPAGVRGLVDFVLRMEARRRIGVLSIAGDRRDEDMREIGSIFAALDHVVLKENEAYRRGRPVGEAARILAEGLDAGGLPPERRETILDEHQALAHAVRMMEEGDVVVILAAEPEKILAQIEGM